MSKAIILVAVRLKSSRLKKKALINLSGKPLIIRLSEKLLQAKLPDEIIWCTSTNPEDDPLEKLANEHSITIFRGSELDVMSRFLEVARIKNAQTIIRVTGDNPLTDPKMLDFMLERHLLKKSHYTYTDQLPVGTRSEIIDVEALKNLYAQLQDPSSSEYMTLMLNRPDKIKTLQLNAYDSRLNRPELRLTVDTYEDLDLFKSLFDSLGDDFTLFKAIEWLDKNPKKILLVSDIFTEIPNSVNIKFMGDF